MTTPTSNLDLNRFLDDAHGLVTFVRGVCHRLNVSIASGDSVPTVSANVFSALDGNGRDLSRLRSDQAEARAVRVRYEDFFQWLAEDFGIHLPRAAGELDLSGFKDRVQAELRRREERDREVRAALYSIASAAGVPPTAPSVDALKELVIASIASRPSLAAAGDFAMSKFFEHDRLKALEAERDEAKKECSSIRATSADRLAKLSEANSVLRDVTAAAGVRYAGRTYPEMKADLVAAIRNVKAVEIERDAARIGREHAVRDLQAVKKERDETLRNLARRLHVPCPEAAQIATVEAGILAELDRWVAGDAERRKELDDFRTGLAKASCEATSVLAAVARSLGVFPAGAPAEFKNKLFATIEAVKAGPWIVPGELVVMSKAKHEADVALLKKLQDSVHSVAQLGDELQDLASRVAGIKSRHAHRNSGPEGE